MLDHDRFDPMLKLTRLERLSQLTQEMMRDLGLTGSANDPLQRIAEAARSVLDAERCSILLVKDKDGERGQELSLEATAGGPPDSLPLKTRLPIISKQRGGLT